MFEEDATSFSKLTILNEEDSDILVRDWADHQTSNVDDSRVLLDDDDYESSNPDKFCALNKFVTIILITCFVNATIITAGVGWFYFSDGNTKDFKNGNLVFGDFTEEIADDFVTQTTCNWNFVQVQGQCEECSFLDNEGWVVFQRRTNLDILFNRSFEEYQTGFGDICTGGDFWLGLHKLRDLTSQGRWEFYSEVETFDDSHVYWTKYDRFSVGVPPHYKLYLGKVVDGNIKNEGNGNGWSYHKGRSFSTYDRNGDHEAVTNCGEDYGRGGFWYGRCGHVFVNSLKALEGDSVHDYDQWMTYNICDPDCVDRHLSRSLLKIRKF